MDLTLSEHGITAERLTREMTLERVSTGNLTIDNAKKTLTLFANPLNAIYTK
jgi:hypothetical protein